MPFLGGGESRRARSVAVLLAAAVAAPATGLHAQEGDPVRGLALLVATRDSLPRQVGNGLRCVSCHLDNGTRPYAMPWSGVTQRYPKYRARSGTVESLAYRVNDCFRRSLNGAPLDTNGRAMRDILAYLRGLPALPVGHGGGAGLGVDSLDPAVVGRPVAGRAVYARSCARCHGSTGAGDSTFNAPALWGPRSYNVGAGMARVRVLGAFVHRHMPYDRPGTLTVQEAADVARWINGRPRPDFREKINDWPNGDAPPDVPYKTRGRSKP